MRKTIKILIVDDLLNNRLLLGQMINILNLNYQLVENGEEALLTLFQEQFDIIFMDIEMPKMNGIEATEVIRSLDFSQRKIPIIAVSAHISDKIKNKLKIVGFNDYISKPFTMGKLKEIIRKYFKNISLDYEFLSS